MEVTLDLHVPEKFDFNNPSNCLYDYSSEHCDIDVICKKGECEQCILYSDFILRKAKEQYVKNQFQGY